MSIGGGTRKREGGSGGAGRESVQELVREVRKEMSSGSTAVAGAGGGTEDQEELCFEVVATVLEIFGRMDSLVSQSSSRKSYELTSALTWQGHAFVITTMKSPLNMLHMTPPDKMCSRESPAQLALSHEGALEQGWAMCAAADSRAEKGTFVGVGTEEA